MNFLYLYIEYEVESKDRVVTATLSYSPLREGGDSNEGIPSWYVRRTYLQLPIRATEDASGSNQLQVT